jgi:hemolysin III
MTDSTSPSGSPWLQKFREPVSGLTHLLAAAAGLVGLAVLLWQGRTDLPKEISLLIYGASVIFLFSASAAYHLVRAGPAVILRLRKLDHAAIYVLIAGSYTPICLYFFEGFWRWGLLAVIWGMALAGVIVKLFVIRAPRWVTAGIYLLMGWLSAMAVQEMLRSMPPAALAWLVGGGLFYTVGAVIYITKKLDFYPGVFGFHEVWHIFVILGSLSHYIVVAAFIAPAGSL